MADGGEDPSLEELRGLLKELERAVPRHLMSSAWNRDGYETWALDIRAKQDPAALAQAALQVEKAIKRKAHPKWWKHERPMWIQGLLTLSKSAAPIAGCEPNQLLLQLLTSFRQLVSTLDLSCVPRDASRRVVQEDVNGDAAATSETPLHDFLLSRKRRRLAQGEPALPPPAVARLRTLARCPVRTLWNQKISPTDDPYAWGALILRDLEVVPGGIGTFDRASEHRWINPWDVSRAVQEGCNIELVEGVKEVPSRYVAAVCSKALDALSDFEGIAIFEIPIHEAIASAPLPNYLSQIASGQELDLTVIRDRVKAQPPVYSTVEAFRDDVRIMFQNAIDYHSEEHTNWIARLAAELHVRFELVVVPRAIDEVLSDDTREDGAKTVQHAVSSMLSSVRSLEQYNSADLLAAQGALKSCLRSVQLEVGRRLKLEAAGRPRADGRASQVR